jgi:hypothetical protein
MVPSALGRRMEDKMLAMLALAIAMPARAGDFQPGLLPGSAATLDAGEGQVGLVGVAAGFGGDGEAFGHPGGASGLMLFHGSVGVTDRLAIGAAGYGFGVGGGALVDARYNLVQNDHVRFGPLMGAASLFNWGTNAPLSGGFAGVAVEWGHDAVRFDASLPLIGVVPSLNQPIWPILPLAGGALGVTWSLGEHQALRLGIDPGVSPNVAWRYASGHGYLQVHAGTVAVAAPAVGLEGGVTF